MTFNDRSFMARAIKLADRGLYSTRPNPRVGCVLVKNGLVVGEGWHERAGQPHAEINALEAAGPDAAGSTAYVTLEPCSHSGRTGPCCEALVGAGIKRCVGAMEDPYTQVKGSGFEYLERQGVEVVRGLLQAEAEQLNQGYLKRCRTGRPYVRCKLAMSLDGRTGLADGTSKWITGEAARSDVQTLRARSCAIVTGIGTLLADDPRLTIRSEQLSIPEQELALQHPPARVILDTQLRTPGNARCLSAPGQVTIVHAAEALSDHDRVSELRDQGVQLISAELSSAGQLDLHQVLKLLGQQDYNELLFETGASLAGSLISAQLFDEMIIYVSAKLLGDSGLPLMKLPLFTRMDQIINLSFGDVRQLGPDLRITVYPKVPSGDSEE